MIMVDIDVPGVNQTYDFNVDENVQISLLVEELVGMICQKEQSTLVGSIKELLLVCPQRQAILNSDMTLSYYNIVQGDRLMLL